MEEGKKSFFGGNVGHTASFLEKERFCYQKVEGFDGEWMEGGGF